MRTLAAPWRVADGCPYGYWRGPRVTAAIPHQGRFRVSRKRSTAKLVQRLSNLGYDVTLVPKAA